MTWLKSLVFLFSLVSLAAATTLAQEPAAPATPAAGAATPEKPTGEDSIRVVCHLRSVPVSRLATDLTAIFPKPPVGPVIVPETHGNSLLVSGPKPMVEEVQRLIAELDHPAAMVRLELRISEVDSAKVKKADETSPEKEKSTETAKGDLFVASATEEGTPQVRADVTTLDNQAARIFLGRMEARASGAVVNKVPVSVNSQMVGTQIDLTPRMDRDNTVVLNLKLSDSRAGSAEHDAVITVAKDAPPLRMPSTEQFQAESTVHLQDGKTLYLGCINRDGPTGKTRLISVTAHVIRLDDAKTRNEGKDKR